MAFDKAKYDLEYRKKHKVQFNVDLSKDENEKLNELLKKGNLKKAEFLRWAIKKLEEDLKK